MSNGRTRHVDRAVRCHCAQRLSGTRDGTPRKRQRGAGTNDYILRDPHMEADADILAARALRTRPVKAFLERVLALTKGQNWDAKHRLKVRAISSIN